MSVDVGGRFKEFRLKAGETQESLAERTGVSRPTIQKVEATGRASVKMLNTLLEGCNSSLTHFFESHTPDIYPDRKHAEMHEKLQVYLDKADKRDAESVEIVIEALYRTVQGVPKR